MSKVMPWLGGALTLLVVCTLFYLLAVAKVEVPQPVQWVETPSLIICQSTPGWVRPEDVTHVLNWWQAQGHPVSGVQNEACLATCTGINKLGVERLVPCYPGSITISLADATLDPDHVAETTRPVGDTIPWVSIVFTGVFNTPDDPMEEPAELKRLTIAHELGHAFGFEHTRTSIGCGVGSVKSGHIMNPDIDLLGWNTEGITP